jgi:hypothetical protein
MNVGEEEANSMGYVQTCQQAERKSSRRDSSEELPERTSKSLLLSSVHQDDMALLYQAAEQASWTDTGPRNQCGLAVGEPTAAQRLRVALTCTDIHLFMYHVEGCAVGVLELRVN